MEAIAILAATAAALAITDMLRTRRASRLHMLRRLEMFASPR